MRIPMKWSALGAALGAIVLACVLVTSAFGGAKANKQIVVFLPPTSDPYAATWLKYGTAAAKQAGYTIKAIQTADASAAASQVEQVVGGTLPAAFVWWPIDPKAQIGSLARLHNTGVPVFQANQLPVKGSQQYLTAYSGVSDLVVGRQDGLAAVAARNALKAAGVKIHGQGTVLVTALPPGYGATVDRLAGFRQAIAGSGLKIIGIGNTKGFDAQDAFNTTSELIAAHRSAGFDIVYGEEDDFAIGAIQALDQAGFHPSKNVEVIGGSCHGNDSQLRNGKQFSTVIQGAGLEGRFAFKTVAQYLKTKKVNPGTYQAPSSVTEPPIPATISTMNLIPVPWVTAKNYVKGSRLWGEPSSFWCQY